MASYDDGVSLAAARDRYFDENGFGRGYDDRWVRLRLGGRYLPVLPNTRARVAAARIHDLHHVATGYDTSWLGEGEIGAWELASGCGPYLAAWVLNLGAFGVGCWISPRSMLRAFVRGRRTKNLYAEGYDPARLARSVGELRRELKLDQPVPEAGAADLWLFAGWIAIALLYTLGGVLSFALLALAMWKMPREPRPADDEMSIGAQSRS
jgi:hypothetical protein